MYSQMWKLSNIIAISNIGTTETYNTEKNICQVLLLNKQQNVKGIS